MWCVQGEEGRDVCSLERSGLLHDALFDSWGFGGRQVRFLVGRLGVAPLLIADVEGRSGASLVQDSCHLQLEAFINKVGPLSMDRLQCGGRG